MARQLYTWRRNIWLEAYDMKEKAKKRMRPLLFTIGGALAGLTYYHFIGCATGSCPITANPISSMIYMGVLGWLLSGVFGRECDGGCSM